MEPVPERPLLRASDADRERYADALREAYAEGRLGVDEHAERLDRVWQARTLGELEPLVADLPAGSRPSPPPAVRRGASVPDAPDPGPVVAIFSGSERRPVAGTSRLVVAAVFGGADIDLRDALGPHGGGRTFHLTATCIFGGCDVIVPKGVEVRLGGLAIFGGNSDKSGPTEPGAPVLIVDGLSLFGGLDVKLAKEDRKRK